MECSPQLRQLSSRSQAVLKKVLLGENGISHRHFAMPTLEAAFDLRPDVLHARFAGAAPSLGVEAAQKAMLGSQTEVPEIDALLVCTCTGYLCPGLSSYVSEALGLRPQAVLYDLAGQGCGAALPMLNMADALLKSGQCRRVLAVAVEVCSAAFYLDNDVGVLVSACLFGDGAGAVVLGKEPGPERRVEWKKFATKLNAGDRELLRFETRGGMLRNVLDKSIPLLVVEELGDVLRAIECQPSAFDEFIFHSGGRDVLAAIERGLEIERAKLHWTESVLKDFGNVSSPSVLFSLERALKGGGGPGRWLMSAFGAGISCHGAILEVR